MIWNYNYHSAYSFILLWDFFFNLSVSPARLWLHSSWPIMPCSVAGDNHSTSTRLYWQYPMKKPKATSVTLWRPRRTREKPTMTAQSMTSTRSGAARTRWASRKRAHIAARVAWPDGKEYLSTENVANMSMRLWAGRRRRTTALTMPTSTKSNTKPERKRDRGSVHQHEQTPVYQQSSF